MALYNGVQLGVLDALRCVAAKRGLSVWKGKPVGELSEAEIREADAYARANRSSGTLHAPLPNNPEST